jgi:hypothetical protein
MTTRRLTHSFHTHPLPSTFLLSPSSLSALHVFLHTLSALSEHPYSPQHFDIHLLLLLPLPSSPSTSASLASSLASTYPRLRLRIHTPYLSPLTLKDTDIHEIRHTHLTRLLMSHYNLVNCVLLETQDMLAKRVLKLTVKGRGIDVPQAAATQYKTNGVTYNRYCNTITEQECTLYCSENNIDILGHNSSTMSKTKYEDEKNMTILESSGTKSNKTKTKKNLNALVDGKTLESATNKEFKPLKSKKHS